MENINVLDKKQLQNKNISFLVNSQGYFVRKKTKNNQYDCFYYNCLKTDKINKNKHDKIQLSIIKQFYLQKNIEKEIQINNLLTFFVPGNLLVFIIELVKKFDENSIFKQISETKILKNQQHFFQFVELVEKTDKQFDLHFYIQNFPQLKIEQKGIFHHYMFNNYFKQKKDFIFYQQQRTVFKDKNNNLYSTEHFQISPFFDQEVIILSI